RAAPCLSLLLLSRTSRRPPRSTLSPYTTLFRSVPRAPRCSMHCALTRAARFRPFHAGSATGNRAYGYLRPVRPVCLPQEMAGNRSEEHTSELQSRENLVCRLLLEKKKHTKRT